ncbi:MAG: helix-turn-helix domain-containing protein [Patescibacteria group bacterium]
MTAGFVTKKIGGKKRSLGAILKTARTKSGLTLEQAEQQTCIAAKHLRALEGGQYDQMPAEAYNIGYVRCYAEFLKLNPEKIVQLYRFERSDRRLGPIANAVHQLRPARLGDWSFLVTPKLLGVIGMLAVFGGVSGYIVYQVRKFAEPPMLELTNVPSEFTSNRDTVLLEGRTTGGATVSMNAEPIYVGADGKFSQDVQLSPGLNQITIQAKNRVDKESRLMVQVLYKQDVAKASDPNQAN